MPMYIPHDVFKHILSFKDPRYKLVRGGGKTPSAWAMPFETGAFMDLRNPWDGNTLFIWNQGAIEHHGKGQRQFIPNRMTGGHCHNIIIYSLYDTVDIVFDTARCCLPNPPKRDLWLQCEACGPDIELYAQ